MFFCFKQKTAYEMRISDWSSDVALPLLDVDNGPDGLTRAANDRLYGNNGLKAAYAALRPEGVLAVWSSAPDSAFTQRLRKAGFDVREVKARAHAGKGGHQDRKSTRLNSSH